MYVNLFILFIQSYFFESLRTLLIIRDQHWQIALEIARNNAFDISEVTDSKLSADEFICFSFHEKSITDDHTPIRGNKRIHGPIFK